MEIQAKGKKNYPEGYTDESFTTVAQIEDQAFLALPFTRQLNIVTGLNRRVTKKEKSLNESRETLRVLDAKREEAKALFSAASSHEEKLKMLLQAGEGSDEAKSIAYHQDRVEVLGEQYVKAKETLDRFVAAM